MLISQLIDDSGTSDFSVLTVNNQDWLTCGAHHKTVFPVPACTTRSVSVSPRGRGQICPPRLTSLVSHMLGSLSPSVPIPSTMCSNEVDGYSCQVMIPSLELLQVVVVHKALLPEVLEQVKVWSAGPECFAEHHVAACDVLHTRVLRSPLVISRSSELTQRTLHRLGWLFTAEITQAVRLPLLAVVRYVRAAQEPEGALIRGCPELC